MRDPRRSAGTRGKGLAHLVVVAVLSDHVLNVLDQVRRQRLGVLHRAAGLFLQLCGGVGGGAFRGDSKTRDSVRLVEAKVLHDGVSKVTPRRPPRPRPRTQRFRQTRRNIFTLKEEVEA